MHSVRRRVVPPPVATRSVILGMLFAAAVAWFACPVPPRRPFTLNNILGFAAFYTSITTAACAVGAALTQSNRRREVWRISAIAIWFAPLSIFTIERSPLAVAAALVLAIMLLWEQSRPSMAASSARKSPADYYRLARQFPSSMLIAALAQLSAVALLLDRLLFALACSLCAMVLLFSRIRPQRRPAWTVILATCVAFAFTLAGLLPFLQPGGGYAAHVAGANAAVSTADTSPGIDTGGDYAGVIMYPEVESHVTLVPPLPFMNRELFSEKRSEPLSIPFYGAYWFFKPPNRRPPPSSVTLRGTPEKKSFRSTSLVPLVMEAHQNLGRLFDVSCCSKIQIGVRNADRLPHTVGLELRLVNTTLAGAPFETLGIQAVESSPAWQPPADPQPASEILTFPVPARPKIRQFDELSIRFIRARYREDRSARVGIERFILIPRGR
jgi:hypothetical protein